MPLTLRDRANHHLSISGTARWTLQPLAAADGSAARFAASGADGKLICGAS
jgi:hypothetical protein